MEIERRQIRVWLWAGVRTVAAFLVSCHLGAQTVVSRKDHPKTQAASSPAQASSGPGSKARAGESRQGRLKQRKSRPSGEALQLTPAGNLRAAPINAGVQGGYSSGMESSQPAPANPALEEQVMQHLLLGPSRWRVGRRGLIERRGADGRWTVVPSSVKADLYAISFFNSRVGWAVGAHGTVLRTEDGGRQWQIVPFPIRKDLIRVRADGPQSVEVTTRDGNVLVTFDGGKSWTRAPAHGPSDAHRVRQ